MFLHQRLLPKIARNCAISHQVLFGSEYIADNAVQSSNPVIDLQLERKMQIFDEETGQPMHQRRGRELDFERALGRHRRGTIVSHLSHSLLIDIFSE